MLTNNNDPVTHWLTLAFPVLILFSGLFALFCALTGWSKIYENSNNPRMQDQLAQWGKTKARIVHGLVSLPLIAFGGWLLYCWLKGPMQH